MPQTAPDYDDDIYDEDDEQGDHRIKDLRQKLKDANKRAKERDDYAAKVAEYERREAIRSAGLGELSEKRMKALLAAHGDGPMTADALRESAVEMGWASPPAKPGDDISPEERAAHERINESMHGAIPPGVREDLNAQIANAQTPEEVMALIRAAGGSTPQQ